MEYDLDQVLIPIANFSFLAWVELILSALKATGKPMNCRDIVEYLETHNQSVLDLKKPGWRANNTKLLSTIQV